MPPLLTGIINTLKEQKVWMILTSIALILFLYGELTGTRLLNSTTTERWAPGGVNTYNRINHK